VHVCVTGYTGDRRADLITIVNLLGAEYLRVLDRKSTHLVCYEFEGAKWAKANQTKLQLVVSHKWLEECLRQWRRLPEAEFAARSGKEEDRLAEAEAEVPDSEGEEDDFSKDINARENLTRGGVGGGLSPTRHSLGTFVTELTAGMFSGGVADADADAEMAGMEAGGFFPANDDENQGRTHSLGTAPTDEQTPNTAMRAGHLAVTGAVTNGSDGNGDAAAAAAGATAKEVLDRFAFSSEMQTQYGAETQEAGDALEFMSDLENHQPPQQQNPEQVQHKGASRVGADVGLEAGVRRTRANVTVANAAAGVLELARGGNGGGGSVDAAGELTKGAGFGGAMEPPPSRAPMERRGTGGGKVTLGGQKSRSAGAAPAGAGGASRAGGGSAGAEQTSPDWGELEKRASQDIERSVRNRMDPLLRDLLAAGEQPPVEMCAFAGRIGSPGAVEAAFGGRFMDRQPQRWHRFDDADAPLAADSFATFLVDISAGTWAPDLEQEDDDGAGSTGWAERITSGTSSFEVLTCRPRCVPPGVDVMQLPRTTIFLAYLDNSAAGHRGRAHAVTLEDMDTEGADVANWIELVKDAAQKKERGPLGAAVISRLRLEVGLVPTS